MAPCMHGRHGTGTGCHNDVIARRQVAVRIRILSNLPGCARDDALLRVRMYSTFYILACQEKAETLASSTSSLERPKHS